MKSKTQFRIFHTLMQVFYLYMYVTAVFDVDIKFGIISHKQFGFVMAILILVTFVLFHKTLIKKLKNYLNLKKGKISFKLFKVSVILLMTHFGLSVITGIMMNFGFQTYSIHALSKYIVPVIVTYHVGMRLYTKKRS